MDLALFVLFGVVGLGLGLFGGWKLCSGYVDWKIVKQTHDEGRTKLLEVDNRRLKRELDAALERNRGLRAS